MFCHSKIVFAAFAAHMPLSAACTTQLKPQIVMSDATDRTPDAVNAGGTPQQDCLDLLKQLQSLNLQQQQSRLALRKAKQGKKNGELAHSPPDKRVENMSHVGTTLSQNSDGGITSPSQEPPASAGGLSCCRSDAHEARGHDRREKNRKTLTKKLAAATDLKIQLDERFEKKNYFKVVDGDDGITTGDGDDGMFTFSVPYAKLLEVVKQLQQKRIMWAEYNSTPNLAKELNKTYIDLTRRSLRSRSDKRKVHELTAWLKAFRALSENSEATRWAPLVELFLTPQKKSK
jgi:hypothetical protein